MTFFIDGPEKPPQIKSRNPDLDIPSFFGGLSAAFTSSSTGLEANFGAARAQVSANDQIAKDAATRLGMEPFQAMLEERNQKMIDDGYPSQVKPIPKSADDLVAIYGSAFSDKVLEMAREDALANPDKWADLDLSPEAIEQSANADLQAKYEEGQRIMEMMPSGRGIASFLGESGAILTDVKNLPFMFMGGGGASLKAMMFREAKINVAAELAFMPSQFDMAERLDIPDPNVAAQLAMAAGVGAGFGALGRGFAYWKGRNEIRTPIQGYDDIEAQSLVGRAEQIMESDTPNPLGDIERMMDANPPKPENPINPAREPLISEDRITVEKLPGIEGQPSEPLPVDTVVNQAQAAIDEVAAARGERFNSKPFTQRIRSDVKIHPDGAIAAELRNAGVTPKSMPGLFSRKGQKDLDTLVASEWEEAIPGISDIVGVDGNGYLSPQGIVNAITEEMSGGRLPTHKEIELRIREGNATATMRGDATNAADDFARMEPSDPDGGLFIDRDQYEFGGNADADIEAVVLDWMDLNGYNDILSEAERREVITKLQQRGGDVEYLVERVAEREVDFAEVKNARTETEDVPFGSPDPEGGQGSVRTEGDTGANGGGGARQSHRGGDARQAETTPAGQQTLIDGVAPISQRDRLEAAQNAPLRGGNSSADDGLFDLGARTQRDMFSDPASPEAREIQDVVADDIRTAIEKDGDYPVDMGDGRGERTASEVLAEMDANDDFLDAIDLCGKAKT